jgi:hypothetical protein
MIAGSALARAVMTALESDPPRIPLLTGECGTGRTYALCSVRDAIGAHSCQYVDVERAATTPERFLQSITTASPFTSPKAGRHAAGTREAFDAALHFLASARRQDGEPATFLLDEVLELKTFESFPGLRGALADLVAAIASSSNRFALSTRYAARAARLLGELPQRILLVPVQALPLAETWGIVAPVAATDGHNAIAPSASAHHVSRLVHALANGRAAYARAIADMMLSMKATAGGDPVSALTALLSPRGALTARCHFSYELRLHRARGYGALKAILDILAEEQPLTLTTIAKRLGRTPGSTKDYLSWLEDVDLVSMHKKRYSFNDTLLRLYVRLHCRLTQPSEELVAQEVQLYALSRIAAVAAGTLPDQDGILAPVFVGNDTGGS